MTVSYIGKYSVAGATRSSVVLNAPTGIQNNDLLLAVLGVDDHEDTLPGDPPAGWSLMYDSDTTSTLVSSIVYYKFVDLANDPTSWTFTTSISNESTAAMLAFRGVTLNGPGVPTFSSTNSVGPITAKAGGMVIGIYTNHASANVTPPTGYTEISDIAYTYGSTEVVYKSITVDGDNTITWSVSGTSPVFVGFALDPQLPPTVPTIKYPISGTGSTINTKPTIIFNISSRESGTNSTNAQIQISQVSDFTTTVVDAQYGNDVGYGSQTGTWSGFPTVGSAFNTINFSPSTSLPIGTYYVRVRSKSNIELWGSWSTSPTSLIIATKPWNDNPSNDASGLKAQWINDITTRINQTRLMYNLKTFDFRDPTITSGTIANVVHIIERFDALTEVASTSGINFSPTRSEFVNINRPAITYPWYNGTTSPYGVRGSLDSSVALSIDSVSYSLGGKRISATNNSTNIQDITIFSAGSNGNDRTYLTTVTANTQYTMLMVVKGITGYTGTLYVVPFSYAGVPFATLSELPAFVTPQQFSMSGDWQLQAFTFTTPANANRLRLECGMLQAKQNDQMFIWSMFLLNGNPMNTKRSATNIIEMRNYLESV